MTVARRARRGLRCGALASFVPLVACAQVFGIDSGPLQDDTGGTAGARGGVHAGSGGAGPGAAGGRDGTAGGTAGQAAMNGDAARAGDATSGGGESGGGESGGGESGGGESGGGESGGEPNAATAGGADGGAAGVSGGTTGAAGVHEGAAGSSAGAAGAAESSRAGLATYGEPCEPSGAYACSDADSSAVLICNKDGVWALNGMCDETARCNPASPGCSALDADCLQLASRGPACSGNEVLDCSPDLYTERHLACPFGCDGGACIPAGEGELTLHTGVVKPQGRRWSGPIPVCLALPDTDQAEVIDHFAWVRSEVENVWNRYSNVTFSGFGSCAQDATGVVVSFPTGCDGHLVNDVAIGTEGNDVAIPLEICLSYYAPGAPEGAEATETVESVTRLLARHQFGHVLGLTDGDDPRETVMVRGVYDLNRVDDIVPTVDDYGALEHAADPPNVSSFEYLGKPALSLVTAEGECVGAAELGEGAALAAGACGSSGALHWSPPSVRLGAWDAPPAYCASQASPGAPVTLAACALDGSPSEFRMPSVEWRTPTACVAADASEPGAGTSLVTSACTGTDDPTQRWYFEILGAAGSTTEQTLLDEAGFLARIHLVGTAWCVSIANVPAVGLPRTLALDACSTGVVTGDPQIFTLERDLPWSGATQTIGTIVANDGSVVDWQPDGGNVYAQWLGTSSAWFVSGPLVNDDGLALTRADDGTLVAQPLVDPLPSTQVFDFYF